MCYRTTLFVKDKLLPAMVERVAEPLLAACVEIDGTYLRGDCPTRGSANKIPLALAVESNEQRSATHG